MSGDLRLYALIRTDLAMPAGKLAVQAGHAFIGALMQSISTAPDHASTWHASSLQKKICLRVKNLAELEKLARLCQEACLPHFLVTDAGLTVFDGPTITALGIGPISPDDLPKAIQRLQLLN